METLLGSSQRRGATLRGTFYRLLLGIPPQATTCVGRGFDVPDAAVRQRLDRIGATFAAGYHAALDQPDPEALAMRLAAIEMEWRGFAYEGAAMALALLDTLLPWRGGRFSAFVRGPAECHVYMALVGAGWAFARVGRRLERYLAHFDPLLRWLVVDGYGFHEGYFHSHQVIARRAYPRRLAGYACCAFDQGLGRSLWFVYGANVRRLPEVVAEFEPARQADLWSGLGLACGYAGGSDRAGVEQLRGAAGRFAPHLAQGVAFAAKARQRAGVPAPHTDLACAVCCGRSSEAAAALTDWALVDLPLDGQRPAYEIWRERIRHACS